LGEPVFAGAQGGHDEVRLFAHDFIHTPPHHLEPFIAEFHSMKKKIEWYDLVCAARMTGSPLFSYSSLFSKRSSLSS
jgi:hypothetical protein